jgi:hypothetical protein
MTTRDYLLRSILILVAAIAGYPSVIWLGHTISGGGMGGMFAAFVLVPIMLVALAVYWISITRKRVRQAELALAYQVPLYASLIGAAQGFIIFPVVIAGNLAVSRISTPESLRYIVDPFLPLVMLLIMTIFVAFAPAHTGGCITTGLPEALYPQPFIRYLALRHILLGLCEESGPEILTRSSVLSP